MSPDEVAKLPAGLYGIRWRDDYETSLAVFNGSVTSPGWGLHTHNRVFTDFNPWPLVEDATPIRQCATPDLCKLREALLESSKPNRIALADALREQSLDIIRDLFMSGRDVEALAMLTDELGFKLVGSRSPPLRPLKVGDPVVVVTWGRVRSIVHTTGPTRSDTFHVGFFSEGLGYDPNGTRDAWFEPDEVRYSIPPERIVPRIRPGVDRPFAGSESEASYNELRPDVVENLADPWERLTDAERLEQIKRCCTMCGALKLPNSRCGCNDPALVPYVR